MALTDIVFIEGDTQEFILEVPTGTLNAPDDILFESDSNTGAVILEIGPTYPDVNLIAQAIWEYENRQLTS